MRFSYIRELPVLLLRLLNVRQVGDCKGFLKEVRQSHKLLGAQFQNNVCYLLPFLLIEYGCLQSLA